MAKKPNPTKFPLIITLVVASVAIAGWLYYMAGRNSQYLGLPTVPCVDSSLPIVQNYTLTIKVQVDGNNMPLPSSLGHDYGNCLHAIHTDDASGTVKVTSNSSDPLTLGQFFDVWKLTFNDRQLGSHFTGDGHTLTVEDGSSHNTNLRDIRLKAGQTISVIYQ